jgi:hypothetical protein
MQRKAGLLTRGSAKAASQSGKCLAGNKEVGRVCTTSLNEQFVEDATTIVSKKNWYNERQ